MNRGLTGTNPIKTISIADTSVSGKLSAVWMGIDPSGVLKISSVLSFEVDALFFAVTVTLKNLGTTTLYEVEYMRTVDPDNEVVRDRVVGACSPWQSGMTLTIVAGVDRSVRHPNLRPLAAVPEWASCRAQQHRRAEHVPRSGQWHDVPRTYAWPWHGAPQLQGVALRLHEHGRKRGVDRYTVDSVQQQQS